MATPRRRPPPKRQPEKLEPEADFDPQRSDPLASLKLWSVDIIVGEQKFTIGPQPASAWLTAILTDDLSVLLEPSDRFAFDELIADGADVKDVFNDAVEVISGRSWIVAVRLAALWIDDQIRGEIATRIDIATAPFAAVLDATYALVVRHMTSEKRVEFENELTVDPELVTDPRSHARRMRERARASGTPSAPTRPRTKPPSQPPVGGPAEPTTPPPTPPRSGPDAPPADGSTPRSARSRPSSAPW